MTTKNSPKLDSGHIYIVQLDEQKKIYKIGKNNEINVKKIINQYPKNAKLLFSWNCPIVSEIEKQIINTFGTKFKKCDFGKGCFIGDSDEMIIEISIIINNCHKTYNEMKNVMFMNELFGNDENDTIELSCDNMFKLLDKTDMSSNAYEELHEFNILKEYDRLKKNKDSLGLYDKAIYNICECIIDCVNHDKQNGDYSSPENNEKLKEAGKMLYDYYGTSAMHDALYLWVPKRYRREIDILWDGIGSWCA